MTLAGTMTSGSHDEGGLDRPLQSPRAVVNVNMGRKLRGASTLFGKKNSGSPGKLGRSGLAEGLSRLRGKGALA